MTFIQITPDMYVNKNMIEWISSVDGGISSKVGFGGREYPSNIPFSSLMSLLKDEVNSKLDAFLSEAGHFAG